MQPIKNIIFDLGGVILNIDFKKLDQAFAAIGVVNFAALYNQHHASPLFKQLEIGAISEKEFYTSFKTIIGVPISDVQIKDAWNTILLDYPAERIALLEKLQTQYRTFLLSNTNAIHYNAFQTLLQKTTGKPLLDSFFEKAYYSHLIQLRKPDAAAFELVLQQNNLLATETLFVDDTISNIEAAQKLHMPTIFITKEKDMVQAFADIL